MAAVSEEIMFYRLTTLFAILIVATSAFAADYYVDALRGNDSNDGQASTSSAGNIGPWKTLARTGGHTFLPGDRIFLTCGQMWAETFALRSDGIESQPLRIGSLPSNCVNKPVIDGSVAISADDWSETSDGRWKTAWPKNLIANGSFDQGPISPWSSWSDQKLDHFRLSTVCSEESSRCARLDVLSATQQALAISNRFPVAAGKQLSLKFRARLPLGHSARIMIRRHAAPWEELIQALTITGTNTWQTYNFSLSPNSNAESARLDLQLLQSNGPLYIDDIVLAEVSTPVIAVHVGDHRQNQAHHPNFGHSVNHPKSPYLGLKTDSTSFKSGNAMVSTSAHVGPDLQLPSGAAIQPGQSIFFRSRAWIIEEHKIASAANGIVTLEDPTLVNLLKDWGFFLSGAKWMTDSPSEWSHDASEGMIYLIPYDGSAPGARARVTHLESGIDLQNRKHITVENIAIRNVRTGILISGATGISLNRLDIQATEEYGIDMVNSTNSKVLDSSFRDTRFDAIAGSRVGSRIATGALIEGNDITGSGVPANPEAPLTLPAPARAAIHAGQYATVRHNRIDRTAYVGIRADRESLIEKNHIRNSCLLLDDGGGIYVKDTNNNGRISFNVIEDAWGNTDGKPAGSTTQTAGIYLDDWTSGIEVKGNTIRNADHGIHVHNAFSNLITGNTFFGNRTNQIWMQENATRIDPLGDIHSNIVTDNHIVPIGVENSIYQVSEFAKPTRFANYGGNIFSTLFSPIVSVETWKDTSGIWQTATYDHDQWLNVNGNLSAQGALQAASVEVSPKAFAQFEIIGESLLPTSAIEDTADGWRTWNSDSTKATLRPTNCPSGSCMLITAGGSDTILISPRFEIVKSHWYRMSFDMWTPSAGQRVEFLVRRGGGGENGYESVMGPKATVIGTGTWKRYAMVFKADKSINVDDPATGDVGARIDFGWLRPGSTVGFGNVEIVPISAVDEVTRLALLSNPNADERWMNCPDIDSSPDLCERYVSFLEQTPIVWPHVVPAHSSAVIFTRNLELIDSDEDGIADSQDACAATPANSEVNAAGCSL